jgi:hypothetical protein
VPVGPVNFGVRRAASTRLAATAADSSRTSGTLVGSTWRILRRQTAQNGLPSSNILQQYSGRNSPQWKYLAPSKALTVPSGTGLGRRSHWVQSGLVIAGTGVADPMRSRHLMEARFDSLVTFGSGGSGPE